jgi:hypothetical protein
MPSWKSYDYDDGCVSNQDQKRDNKNDRIDSNGASKDDIEVSNLSTECLLNYWLLLANGPCSSERKKSPLVVCREQGCLYRKLFTLMACKNLLNINAEWRLNFHLALILVSNLQV